MNYFSRVVALTGVLLATGCGQKELSVPEAEAYPPNFSAIRDRILRPKCENCHAKIVAHDAVMEDLVVAGNPGASELYTEVESDEMPMYRSPLSDEEKRSIKTWIENGAAND
jgi:uncharacterized membrane protein